MVDIKSQHIRSTIPYISDPLSHLYPIHYPTYILPTIPQSRKMVLVFYFTSHLIPFCISWYFSFMKIHRAAAGKQTWSSYFISRRRIIWLLCILIITTHQTNRQMQRCTQKLSKCVDPNGSNFPFHKIWNKQFFFLLCVHLKLWAQPTFFEANQHTRYIFTQYQLWNLNIYRLMA